MGTKKATRIFISYRRADDPFFVGRLYDRLVAAFGVENVFRDIDNIPGGTEFEHVIQETLDKVDAVVAVIGPKWCLHEGDKDYVHLELGSALEHGTPVFPVLIGGTRFEEAVGELPQALAKLPAINHMTVRPDPDFHHDVERLLSALTARSRSAPVASPKNSPTARPPETTTKPATKATPAKRAPSAKASKAQTTTRKASTATKPGTPVKRASAQPAKALDFAGG